VTDDSDDQVPTSSGCPAIEYLHSGRANPQSRLERQVDEVVFGRSGTFESQYRSQGFMNAVASNRGRRRGRVMATELADNERKELAIDEIEDLLDPILRAGADQESSAHDLVLDASGDQVLSALYDARLLDLNRTTVGFPAVSDVVGPDLGEARPAGHRADSYLWALLIDEFRAAGAGGAGAELLARRAIALIRRTDDSNPRTFAPGDVVPIDVEQGYDLDGDVWQPIR
jgi:hypothetical protein